MRTGTASSGAALNNGLGNFHGYAPGLASTPASQNTPHLQNRMNFSNQSPVGMELGEFMIDSDLDFLGRLFDLGRNVDGHALDTGETPDTQRASFNV